MASIFFLLLCLILSSSPFSSSVSGSLRKGLSLSVDEPDNLLISPKGIFSAGFYAVGVNAYCFAIWFAKPSHAQNGTIVWMANRDQPVNGRLSKLSLLENGNLILNDADQSVVWTANTVSPSSVELQLNDSGNLVLSTSQGIILWQSFDWPTDTVLPTQLLTKYTQLISSRSQSNHSCGFYKLFFDDDNVLRLDYNGPETSSFYWPDPWMLSEESGRSRYNDTRIAVFDDRGHFRSSDGVAFQSIDYGVVSAQRRLTLDFDGNLRLYSLEETSGTWVVSWQAISKPCRIHGACGQNSLCSYDPGSGRRCSCLPRFKLRNHTDWTHGCVPEFDWPCNHNEATFMELPHADFYGYNIHILRNYTLERCKKYCLGLRDCRGFQYKFNATDGIYRCYPKRALRNGHRSPNFIGTLYFKVPKELKPFDDEPLKDFSLGCSGKATEQLDRVYKKKDVNFGLKFLLWFTAGVGLVETIFIVLVWSYLYRPQTRSAANRGGYFPAPSGFRKFSYSELKMATRGFREEIGRGSAGVVYKGVLSDNRVAAVKRLNKADQGEAEFLAELSTIGRLHHMNLIEMWGYCAEGKHRILVYEFMENGSLAENIHLNNLDWEKRFNIAVGTARGLAYLHEECLEWILHCDVKPQNILLDSNYQPKVSDFGLSKLLKRGSENISNFSRIRGTRGYMAPEWAFNLPITSKVDVYSYGIVVLEMVTNGNAKTEASPVGVEGGMERTRVVVEGLRKKMSGKVAITSQVEEIVDPIMNGHRDTVKMEKLLQVALRCVEADRDARPTMSQVLEILLHHYLCC